jgi:polysaccharide biosynthesis transport protein
MHNLLNSKSNDEIDVRELFITLWAYKLFIAGACALGIMLGGYYTLNADKKFKSAAIFKLHQNNTDNISFNRDLSALAGIAGLSNNDNNDLPTDQVFGRIFIEKLDAKLNFQADLYFNKYNPYSVDPVWKSLIKSAIGWKKLKSAIGWQKPSIDAYEATWQGIVTEYSKNVVLDETPDGSVKIVVTHEYPERAAEIANVIMDEVITSTKNKMDIEQDQQLIYLSKTLAKALSDLEISQSNLKEFALENSALPLESFAAGSLQLDTLREQLNRASELHEAVAALSLILQDKTTNQNAYLTLRQKFPIVDQVEFRRVLGQNEIISSWSWPELSTIDAVFDTLTERITRLQSKINASQINAERSGLALEAYAKLERDANIAEATYTVLIEQVKAQSMVAGYRPNKTEVYEYAAPPINPSEPKRSMILALGAVLGLFFGAALSLIMALRRGVFYSKNSLATEAQARLMASFRILLPLRNKSLNDVNAMLVKKPRPALRDLAVEIHKSAAKQVVVTSSRTKLTGNDVARALASYMQSETMKVAVIDFSSSAKKLNIDHEKRSVGSFVIADSAGHISILKPMGNLPAIELLGQKSFYKNTQSLHSTFDLVFLCADNSDTISLLSALEEQKTFHITIAKTKKTKSANLIHMRSILPIQGLLYD